MKQNKETLKAYFETGDKPTQEQFSDLIDSYVDSKQPAGDPNRRFVINKNGDVGVASEQKTPEYTLSEITGKKLALLKDGVTVKEIDLTAYLDDTNLARLVSGSIDMNGLATFTRDDDSTFTLDLSNLKDAVPQYQAGTNVTIDTVNPLQPVINFSSKDNSFVPYTGATNDVVLGNHSIDLGKLEDNTITNKNAVILEHQGVPFFRLGVKVSNGTTIGDDYWKSLGIGRDALKSAKGSVNAAYGARAL
ncbi:hypothetical protein [Tenacibaculum halocynthiae]|uniref:hypothetical protein n=1 Tax=Tenacibaculum halocynthiae TaxID=1254437 RepID=UPI00389474E1